MSQCDTCHTMEKLYQCCGRHPLTGSKVQLQLADGTLVTACPHLDIHSRCSIYESRPLGCRQFVCDWYDTAEDLEYRSQHQGCCLIFRYSLFVAGKPDRMASLVFCISS
ncbi:MAG: hypothetical protein ACOCX9_03000 [Spirochaetota bacterium]